MIKNDENYEPDKRQKSGDEQVTEDILQNPAICVALKRLREANDTANACGRDPWDFAVELSQLSDFGVGTHVLRMMICRRWITHMREVSNTESKREFAPEPDLVLSDRSCFVITKKGFDVTTKLKASGYDVMNEQSNERTSGDQRQELNAQRYENAGQSLNQSADQNIGANRHPAPCWDRERRELRIGNVVVKRFKWPAENQEQVLDAFEEEGWPTRIDDPLVPHPKICPKRRLHDTLKCLNRKQVNGFIKFRGDGTGQGVLLEINWESEDPASKSQA
jgi:PHD/YefM family antitoxin component YafN of YafNO toxin-antitoxin module